MRCKVGDLCEVIGGAFNLANIGKIVRVMQYAGEHSRYGAIWQCFQTDQSIITEYGCVGIGAHFADDWLRPLPPDKLPANDFVYDEVTV
jgi:hypothetical protein